MPTWKICICPRADNKRKRTAWVNKYYSKYQISVANAKRIGETTVVAVKWMNAIRIGVATPVNGDKFDALTGIAVAYAKACGERIPILCKISSHSSEWVLFRRITSNNSWKIILTFGARYDNILVSRGGTRKSKPHSSADSVKCQKGKTALVSRTLSLPHYP